MASYLSAAVFVEDLESLIELLVTAWIGRLGDGPQVWEEIVQTDGLLLQLSMGHRLQLVATEKLEDVLVSGIVAEAAGQVGALGPLNQALAAGAIEELERIAES